MTSILPQIISIWLEMINALKQTFLRILAYTCLTPDRFYLRTLYFFPTKIIPKYLHCWFFARWRSNGSAIMENIRNLHSVSITVLKNYNSLCGRYGAHKVDRATARVDKIFKYLVNHNRNRSLFIVDHQDILFDIITLFIFSYFMAILF